MKTFLISFGALGFLAAMASTQAPAPFVDLKTVPDMPPKEVSPGVFARPAPALPEAAEVLAKADAEPARRVDRLFADGAQQVLVDEPGDGSIWGLARSYKFGAGADGGTFMPFLGSDAPQNYPVRFRLIRTTVDGEPVDLKLDAAPVRAGQRVDFDRRAVVEHFTLRADGVEQSFTLPRLAQRGELILTIAVDTELEAKVDAAGIQFATARGGVRYGRAVAIDAGGWRTDCVTEWVGDAIRITVPAAFVATARLPLLVDPLIGAISTISYHVAAQRSADVSAAGEVVTWERVFSQTDSDVLVDDTGQTIVIDASQESWQRPRIASGGGQLWLVVAQVTAAGVPSWIRGRGTIHDQFSNLWYLGARFDIARAAAAGHANGAKLNPDVGVGWLNNPDRRFTVVWERVFSSVDHDIHLKHVDYTEPLVGSYPLGTYTLAQAQPTVIDNSTANETFAAISAASGSQLVVVYQRTFSPIDEDIRFLLVDYVTGQLSPVAYLDYSTGLDVRPTVSTLTAWAANSSRLWMAAWARVGTLFDVDIVGAVGDTAMNVPIPTVNLTQLESDNVPAPHWSWVQTTPVVETDGCRFNVAYAEDWQSSGDMDIRVSSFHVGPGPALGVTESRVWVAQSLGNESQPAITAGPGPDMTLVWQNDRGSANDAIQRRRYGGYGPGGYTVLPTACVPMPMTMRPEPAIGQEIVLEAIGVQGWVVGFPRPQPVACPGSGCVLAVDGAPVAPYISSVYRLQIPCHISFVGLTLAIQPYRLGTGLPCLGIAALGDTVHVTIR